MCCSAESFGDLGKRAPSYLMKSDEGRSSGEAVEGGEKSYVYGEFTDGDGLKFLICERQ